MKQPPTSIKANRTLLFVKFPADTVIFSERSQSTDVYLIRSGRVEIRKQIEAETVLIKALGPQEIFGEMALIHHKPRSASAVAVMDTECYVLNHMAFDDKLKTIDPFLRGVFRVLANTVRELTTELAALKKHD